jgi:hypothetical protein
VFLPVIDHLYQSILINSLLVQISSAFPKLLQARTFFRHSHGSRPMAPSHCEKGVRVLLTCASSVRTPQTSSPCCPYRRSPYSFLCGRHQSRRSPSCAYTDSAVLKKITRRVGDRKANSSKVGRIAKQFHITRPPQIFFRSSKAQIFELVTFLG